MCHVCGFICYLCVELKLMINTRSLSNQALKSAHPLLLSSRCWPWGVLVLVSRYSTVRSGTLTWREWGLWTYLHLLLCTVIVICPFAPCAYLIVICNLNLQNLMIALNRSVEKGHLDNHRCCHLDNLEWHHVTAVSAHLLGLSHQWEMSSSLLPCWSLQSCLGFTCVRSVFHLFISYIRALQLSLITLSIEWVFR